MIQSQSSREIQGVLGLHEFWAREKLMQAKFMLVKLCTISFVKLHASEILSMSQFSWVNIKAKKMSQGSDYYEVFLWCLESPKLEKIEKI